MELGMSYYNQKSIPDANFKPGSSSRFGDMTSQIFRRKKGTSHQIRLFTLKNEFLCPESSFSTQN